MTEGTGAHAPPIVLVIGDVMLDIIAVPAGPIAFATDTPTAIDLRYGGSGANAAAWLGHLGNAVRFAGRAGRDAHEHHAAALRAHGVEPLLAVDADIRTGVLVTIVGSGGERTFLTDRGANARLSRPDLPDTLLEGAAWLHVSGYTFIAPDSRSAIAELLGVAAACGIRTSVDSGGAATLLAVGRDVFLDITRTAEICFLNSDEASVLADTVDREEQLERLAIHYPTVVITCGADGARAATRTGTQRLIAAPRVIEARDTTGAGDAFLAAFLNARMRGSPLQQCLADGVALGSSVVRVIGGRPAVPPQAPIA